MDKYQINSGALEILKIAPICHTSLLPSDMNREKRTGNSRFQKC